MVLFHNSGHKCFDRSAPLSQIRSQIVITDEIQYFSVRYMIVLSIYNDLSSNTSVTQPVIKVDIRGLMISFPGIGIVETICNAICEIWLDYW